MIILDSNVLMYSLHTDFIQHPIARSFLQRQLQSIETIGLPWVSVLAFIRLSTSLKTLQHRLTPSQALDQVNLWLNHPRVSTPEPGRRHFQIMQSLLLSAGQAANLTNDAHLAAIAIERDATMVSFDHDFARFSGLRLQVPHL
jgi:uncharacterized protein